jgi:hypothetical protein
LRETVRFEERPSNRDRRLLVDHHCLVHGPPRASCDTAATPRAQAYLAKHRAAGKTSRDAMRCLKRRLSDVIWRQLIADLTTPPEAPLIE